MLYRRPFYFFFELVEKRRLHRFLVDRNRQKLESFTKLSQQFELPVSDLNVENFFPILRFEGWFSKRYKSSDVVKNLRRANPNFDVSIVKFPRRELLRQWKEIGLFAGFIIEARVKNSLIDQDSAIEAFDFFLANRLGFQEIPIPSNDTVAQMMMQINAKFAFTPQSVMSQESSYIDEIVNYTDPNFWNRSNWFEVFCERNPELVLEVTRIADLPGVAEKSALALSSLLNKEWVDRFQLIFRRQSWKPFSNLKLVRIVRHFEWEINQDMVPFFAQEMVSVGKDKLISRESGLRLSSPKAGWKVLHNLDIYPGSVLVDMENNLHLIEEAANPASEFVSGQWQTVFGVPLNPDFALVKNFPREDKVIPVGIFLDGRNSTNWYHFMAEYLPTVISIPAELSPDIPLLVSGKLHENSVAALQSMSNRRVIALSGSLVQRVRKLFVAAPVLQIRDIPRGSWAQSIALNPSALELYREKNLLLVNDFQSPSRVYLHRKSRHRGLTNQNRLLRVAREKGLVVIDPSELSWPEQLNLFAKADLVVGASGAVMANYIFMKPGSIVIGLTSNLLKDFVLPALLAKISGAKFQYVIGRIRKRPFRRKLALINRMHSDFLIRPKALSDAIDDAIASLGESSDEEK